MSARPSRADRGIPRAGRGKASCARALVRRTLHLTADTHAARGSISAALIDAARSCECEACPDWLRRLEADQRTIRSTRRKATATFALTSGDGRADLGSVAPSTATGAKQWKDVRVERAADALLGVDAPVPTRGDDLQRDDRRDVWNARRVHVEACKLQREADRAAATVRDWRGTGFPAIVG